MGREIAYTVGTMCVCVCVLCTVLEGRGVLTHQLQHKQQSRSRVGEGGKWEVEFVVGGRRGLVVGWSL